VVGGLGEFVMSVMDSREISCLNHSNERERVEPSIHDGIDFFSTSTILTKLTSKPPINRRLNKPQFRLLSHSSTFQAICYSISSL
jgi:hypothetical protein